MLPGRDGPGGSPPPFRAAAFLTMGAALLVGCARVSYSLPPLPGPTPAPRGTPARLDPTPVCWTCFWRDQPATTRRLLADDFAALARAHADPLVRADARLVLGRVTGDSAAVCRAATDFAALADVEREPRRRLLALETVAFLAGECRTDAGAGFARAAAAADEAGERWKASVYRSIAHREFRPLGGPAPIRRALRVPAGATGYVLGASAVRVDSATTIVAQLERVGRDWLLRDMDFAFTDSLPAARLLGSHEGARLRDILAATPARLLPASGVLAIHMLDGRWLAADGAGVFRYEVLPDKVHYPTTRASAGVALLVDTHGISSLVEPALRLGAGLVVGCGDYPAKMQAAFELAARGIAVYFPEDRFVSELIGYDAPGVLLGSAPVRPVRREGDVAVIGDQPVAFGFDEAVVAGTTTMTGDFQYYDAPARFFDRLAQELPIRVEHVTVDAPGRSDRVVARARALAADVVAVRVWNDADHDAVAAWLRESPRHRAVLFHSAAYPAGAALLSEFPRQTTFGDPRVRFVGDH